MREVLIVAGLLSALVALAVVLLAAWETLFFWGWVLVAAGMVLGVPTGLVYHVLLYRALRRKGRLPRGWYWRPFEHHDGLDRRERLVVMPWAYAGGLGFLAIVLGQVLLASVILKLHLIG